MAHAVVAVLILDLNKASDQPTLCGQIRALGADRFGVGERCNHALDPVRLGHAVGVCEQQQIAGCVGHTRVARAGRALVLLPNQPHTFAAIACRDVGCGVQRPVINDDDFVAAARHGLAEECRETLTQRASRIECWNYH